ncbi:MAG: hypothetical protein QOD56_1582 [Gammaproteobacteria bacterium]|nr:hypothetical protein [Gammaproteobacteria bacterium]
MIVGSAPERREVDAATSNPGPALILIMCGLGISVGVAVFGWETTAIAAALPAAAALAWYLIPRPTATTVVIVVFEVGNVAEVVHGPTGVGHLGIVLGVASIAYALRDPAARARLNRGVLWCIGLIMCYLVPQVLATLGSQHLDVSIPWLQTMVIDSAFLVVVLVLILLGEKPWAVAAAVVVPLAVLSLLCLANQIAFHGTATFGGFAMVRQERWGLIEIPRYGGPTVDANFWGRNLVLGLPLAGVLAVRAWRSGRRAVAICWLAATFAILAGVYLTQSRGAYIAAACALVIWVLASGRQARRRGLLSLPFVALLLFVPGVGNRLLALVGDLFTSSSYRVVDPSVVGRQAAQEISWAMFGERPLFGFGPNVFKSEIPNFGGLVPTAWLEFHRGPDAPHNLYAQFACDSGTVGLIGLAIFLGGFIWIIAVRTVRLTETSSERSLAAAVMAAIVGWCVASIFLHLAYFRPLAVVLALAGALAFANGNDSDRGAAADRWRTFRVAIGVLLGFVATGVVFAATSSQTHVASQKVQLMPSEQMAEVLPYALSIRDRRVFLQTYAVIIDVDAPIGATTKIDTARGVITIGVTRGDAATARRGLDEALAHAQTQVNDYVALSAYDLRPIGETSETTGVRWSVRSVLAAASIGIGVGIGVYILLRRRPRGRARHRRLRDSGGRIAAAIDVNG